MTGGLEHAVRVLEAGAPPGLRWDRYRSPGGDHSSNPRYATPVGLCLMFSAPAGRDCQGR